MFLYLKMTGRENFNHHHYYFANACDSRIFPIEQGLSYDEAHDEITRTP